MSGAALVALVILCFAGGYILVSSVFKAFEKPPAAPQPAPTPDYSARSMQEYYRGVLLVPEGASMAEIEQAYQTQRRKYVEAAAARELAEIEEAYDYFRRKAERG